MVPPRKPQRNIIGSRVRSARADLDLTQDELAARLQLEGIRIAQSGVAKLESGSRPVYDHELVVLARILKITPHRLLGWRDD